MIFYWILQNGMFFLETSGVVKDHGLLWFRKREEEETLRLPQDASRAEYWNCTSSCDEEASSTSKWKSQRKVVTCASKTWSHDMREATSIVPFSLGMVFGILWFPKIKRTLIRDLSPDSGQENIYHYRFLLTLKTWWSEGYNAQLKSESSPGFRNIFKLEGFQKDNLYLLQGIKLWRKLPNLDLALRMNKVLSEFRMWKNRTVQNSKMDFTSLIPNDMWGSRYNDGIQNSGGIDVVGQQTPRKPSKIYYKARIFKKDLLVISSKGC